MVTVTFGPTLDQVPRGRDPVGVLSLTAAPRGRGRGSPASGRARPARGRPGGGVGEAAERACAGPRRRRAAARP
ncbi:MAG: hypothetical protein R3B09_25175, partial [Nannocystaceae bacterium]